MRNSYRHFIHPRFVIAEMLGASLEGYFQRFPQGKQHKDDEWISLGALDTVRDIKVRVRAGCEGILAQADAFVAQNFYEMVYMYEGIGYRYLVPNSARERGYVRINFGFGVITDPDGTFVAQQWLLSLEQERPIPAEHTLYVKLIDNGSCVFSHYLDEIG